MTPTTLKNVRKGVSPLIAAVLLIAFTMAVAAILTAWVTTFTQEQTAQVGNQSEQVISCSGGVIDILDTNHDSENDELYITIANVGNVDFSNVTITALGGGSVVGDDFVEDFSSGDTWSPESDNPIQIRPEGSPVDSVRVASRNCPSVAVTENNP